ncbi:MAG: hypothetical protein M1826_006012 [Phylliscum demangeonii]|nr:MAG: hypothetical protein M1826_006012 [Phylliscum demangeonii]
MQATMAFHSVKASRSFRRPFDVRPASPHQSESPQRTSWPPSVRKYVQRAFQPEHDLAGIERTEVEEKLKQIITDANQKNALLAIDWDRLPLPQQMIQEEKKDVASRSSGRMSWYPRQPVTEPPNSSHSYQTDVVSHNKKRKSSETSYPYADDEPAHSTHLDTNHHNLFEDRVSYPTAAPPTFESRLTMPRKKSNSLSKRSHGEGGGKTNGKLPAGEPSKRQRRLDNAAARVANSQAVWPTEEKAAPAEKPPSPASIPGPVVGQCRELEKKYFRLTAPPKPETVRPLEILRQTFDLLKQTWKTTGNYSYICDQFKSLRQDLTVQHIKNDFTVQVYECHARIALERGDLGEYNQCQTQLRSLYDRHLAGHALEFTAYEILYLIYTRNPLGMSDMLVRLTDAAKNDASVKHALAVRKAVAAGDYHTFFKLYGQTPNMGAYLMDMFLERERLRALATMCKAYRPDLDVRFIAKELAFDTDQDLMQFLTSYQCESFVELRGDIRRLMTPKARPAMEMAMANAFRLVDIKGQL